jgi:hypothetical protein
MIYSLSRGLLSVTVAAIVLIPQRAFSSPLFDDGNWRGQSFYAKTSLAGLSSGIGGLQANITGTKNLRLEPSALSYGGGYLRVMIKNKQVEIKIRPEIVLEAVKVVESTNKLVFQTSIDDTQTGQIEHTDEALLKKGKEIGEILLKGDYAFAGIVQGGEPYPNRGAVHPYIEARRLLDKDPEYHQLTSQWKKLPESWPQIYLYFNPAVKGLVSFEFKPQVLFRSPDSLPLEVDKNIQTIGERPYLPLVKDIKEHPFAYREISPALDEAASITATLGVVKSACKKVGSCSQLENQAQARLNSQHSEESINKEGTSQLSSNSKGLDFVYQLKKTKWDLEDRWEDLGLPVFQPGNTSKAWAAAYDTVQSTLIAYDTVRHADFGNDLTRALTKKQKLMAWLQKGTAQQFLNYPVPNDPLLQSASAVILALNNKEVEAGEKINQAIELAAKHPGDSIEVMRIGLNVAKIITDAGNAKLGNEIQKKVEPFLIKSWMAAYDQVDKYLNDCNKDLIKCPEKDLRKWEAEAVRSQLIEIDNSATLSAESYNIAWLYGRFAYLIGIQLKDRVKQMDRLRFLSHYVEKTEGQNHEQLQNLESDFKRRLGINTDDTDHIDWHAWLFAIFMSGGFFTIFKVMSKQKIQEKRRQLEKML